MKTLISSLIVAFTLTLSSAFAQTNKSASFTPNVIEDSQFFVQPFNTGKVDVTVVKPEGSNLILQIVDSNGTTLAKKFITKHSPLTRTRFDLTELPDGLYHIVVLEGSSKQVKDVILNTTASETSRTVNFS